MIPTTQMWGDTQTVSQKDECDHKPVQGPITRSKSTEVLPPATEEVQEKPAELKEDTKDTLAVPSTSYAPPNSSTAAAPKKPKAAPKSPARTAAGTTTALTTNWFLTEHSGVSRIETFDRLLTLVGTIATTTAASTEALPTPTISLRELEEAILIARRHEELLLTKKRIKELEQSLREDLPCRSTAVPEEPPVNEPPVNESCNFERSFAAPTSSSMLLTDIQGALPTFSGDNDLYDVAEFFAEFEELTRAVSADATQCLLLLRRSLRSTAKLVMRGAMAHSYEELKAKLLQEFRFCLTLEQVYARLRSHRWDGSSPVELYVEEILTLAKKAGIPQGEAVQIIIDHLSSHGPDVRSCLSAATTAGELKTLVRMRRHLLFFPTARHPATSRAVNSRPPSRPAAPALPDSAARGPTEIRCFNCSSTDGHTKPNCPYPLRPRDSCFKCWQMGHQHQDCPNAAYRPARAGQRPPLAHERRSAVTAARPIYQNPRMVAAVDYRQIEDYSDFGKEEDVPSVNEVSFIITLCEGITRVTKRCLFDTGSPVSLIRRSAVPTAAATQPHQGLRLHAIGGQPLNVLAAVNVEAVFRNVPISTTLLIVPDEYMKIDVILGRDYMSDRRITLRIKKRFSIDELKNLNKPECNPGTCVICKLQTSDNILHLVKSTLPSSYSTPTQLQLSDCTTKLPLENELLINNELPCTDMAAVHRIILDYYSNSSEFGSEPL